MVTIQNSSIELEDGDTISVDGTELTFRSSGELEFSDGETAITLSDIDGADIAPNSVDANSYNESVIDHDQTTNRTHNGDNISPNAIDAGEVSTDALEATTSITDAAGDTHTEELADKDGDDLTPNTIDVATSITDPAGNTVTSLSDPVRVTEEASTFEESDVVVSPNDIQLSDGSIELFNTLGDLSQATYDGDTGRFRSDNQDVFPSKSVLGDAGEKMFIAGTDKGDIYSYTLSTPWQVSSASYEGNSYSVSISLGAFGFKPDGTKMYYLDGDEVIQTTLSTPWDITTATEDNKSFFANADSNNRGFSIAYDGSAVYRVGSGSDAIYEYPMSEAWDISTAFYNDSTPTVTDNPADLTFTQDGMRLYTTHNGSVDEYELTTAWDISTASATGNSLSNTDGDGIFIRPSGADLYLTDFDYVYQYSVGSASNSGDALIEWDSGVPADINSYDLATFQRTLDGETVTIDVEDGNGNVLYSDIGQNFDISTIATDTNVKLRANLSRTNTANNPTLDYVARRFTR